jgi:hypothetical protein
VGDAHRVLESLDLGRSLWYQHGCVVEKEGEQLDMMVVVSEICIDTGMQVAAPQLINTLYLVLRMGHLTVVK